jgi:TATA-binding protein-associated factor Taf7
MQGGIISTALEKEKQADKASARLHDGMKTQMELTANQGSWTGDQSSKSKPAAPTTTVVVQKDSEDDKKDTKDEEEETPTAPGAESKSEDDDKKNIADMGIISLAQGASK